MCESEGRAGKRPKIGECNQVKRLHISVFLEFIYNQLLLHFLSTPTTSQDRVGPCVHLWGTHLLHGSCWDPGACMGLNGCVHSSPPCHWSLLLRAGLLP